MQLLEIIDPKNKETFEYVRNTIRSFGDKELRPVVEDYEEKKQFPIFLKETMGEIGVFGALYPEDLNGSNLGLVSQMIIIEELGRISAGISATVLVQVLSSFPIFVYGNEKQKQQYLVPAIKGEKMGCIAVTEPDYGSDVASIKTAAEKTENGYLINGSKMFITNAPFSDFFVVAAKTDKTQKHKGISLFVIDKDSPGLNIGNKLDKLGWHTSETSEVFFNDCFVPEDNVIGELNQGFKYIMKDFNYERLFLAAQAVGIATEALNEAIKYSKERRQFDTEIINHQAVAHTLAEMATELEVAKNFTYSVGYAYENGIEMIKEISMVKLFVPEVANRITRKAIQIFGGYGYMSEYNVERYHRDSIILTIGGGTSEIQKNVIAKRL